MRTLPFRLKAEALPRERLPSSGVRDFAALAAFIAGGFCVGYFAFWKPLLAPFGY
jgi:hypothetical protein